MFEDKHHEHLYRATAELAQPKEGHKGGLLYVEADTEMDAKNIAVSMFKLIGANDSEVAVDPNTVRVRQATPLEMLYAASQNSFINQSRLEALQAGEATCALEVRRPNGEVEKVDLKATEAVDDGILDAELLM